MEHSQTETRQLRDALRRAQDAASAGTAASKPSTGREEEESHRMTIRELEGSVAELRKDRDVLARQLQVMIGKEETYKGLSNTVKELEEDKRRLTAQVG